MLNYRESLDNANYTITLPVAHSIFDQLLLKFNLPLDTRVDIMDDITEYRNKNWNLKAGDGSDADNLRELIVVGTYRESFTDDIMATNYKNNDTKPVIEDKDSGLFIQPYFEPVKLDVAFTINSKSESVLEKIAAYLRQITTQNQTTSYHSVEYSYYLTPFIKEVLYEVLQARNYVLNEETNLLEWLDTIADDRATTVTNQGRTLNSLDIAFKETQNKVLGMFEEEIHNVKFPYNKDTGFYELELTYTIFYDKVAALDIWYPPIAYNIVLPEEITERFLTNANTLDGNASQNIADGLLFDSSAAVYEISQWLRVSDGYLRIPEFDYHDDMVKVKPVIVDINFPTMQNSLTTPIQGNSLVTHDPMNRIVAVGSNNNIATDIQRRHGLGRGSFGTPTLSPTGELVPARNGRGSLGNNPFDYQPDEATLAFTTVSGNGGIGRGGNRASVNDNVQGLPLGVSSRSGIFTTAFDKPSEGSVSGDGSIGVNGSQPMRSITTQDRMTIARVIGDDVRLPVFSVATVLTPDDLTTLANLDELGEFALSEPVRTALVNGEYQYTTQFLNSIFSLELYENGKKVPGNPIVMDQELNVTATQDLDILKSYRLLFSVIPNINLLDNQAVTHTIEDDNMRALIGNVVGDYTTRINLMDMLVMEEDGTINRKAIDGKELTLTFMAIKHHRSRFISHVVAKRKEQ